LKQWQVKDEVHPVTVYEGLEGEWRYQSTLSLTSAQGEVGWSTPRPGRFTPGKVRQFRFYMWLCGPVGWSGQVRKISPTPVFYPRTVCLVASRYTEWAILAHILEQ